MVYKVSAVYYMLVNGQEDSIAGTDVALLANVQFLAVPEGLC